MAGIDTGNDIEDSLPSTVVRHAISSAQGTPHAERPIACLSDHEHTGASGQPLPGDIACSSPAPDQFLPGDMASSASTPQRCSHSASHAAATSSAMAGADEPSSSQDCTPAAAVRHMAGLAQGMPHTDASPSPTAGIIAISTLRRRSSQSPPSCEWHRYANKNAKLARFPITIARDRAHDNNCQSVKMDKKEYAGFNTFADLLSYVEYQVQPPAVPCMYERVLTIDTLTYLMFDLDRDLESAMPMPQREQVLRAFLRHLTKLLNSLSCEGDVELKIGVNCQVKQAFHANKLSFHVVVYLPDFSLTKSKRVAKAMNALLLGLDKGDPDYELLIKKTEGAPTSIVDLKPYSNGQLLRMLYNCKLKNVVKVPFKPAFGSSVRISDHLINADPDLRPALQLPLMLLPAMDLSRLPEQLPRDEDRGSRPRRTTIASTALPATQLADEERQGDGPGINYVALRQVILDHQPIKEKLGVKTLGLREHVVEGGYCSFPIDPGQCCDTLRCPYAGRKHDNNMYLVYNPRRQLVSLKCHRDQCSDCKDPHYPLRWAVDDLSAVTDTLFDALSAPSLHMPVEFQEVYDGYTVSTTSPHPKMRPYKAYRDRPLLAIRANMGVGKTEQLAEYLAEVLREQPATRILVLSYRRMLADKMVNDLQLDFVNYQDISTDDVFCAPRLVVQLDSIFRVERRKYDIVVMDEALSTLLHTCSAIMREPQPVMRHLQWLLQRAGQVIMLDAVVDSFVCQHFIRYLERLKSTTCLWVRNTAVIPCQRQVNLTICKSDHPEDRKALVDHAIEKVRVHVAASRRVYVPCTSKTTAECTLLSIKRELGSTFEVVNMAEELGQQLAESKQGGSSARGDCGTGGPDGGGGGAGSPDSSSGGAGNSTWWAGGSSPSSSAEGGGGSGGGRSPSSIGAASMASNASGGGKSSGVASGVGGCSRDGGNGDGGSRPHGGSRGNSGDSGDSSDSSGINVTDFKVTEASVRQTAGSATGPAGMVATAAEGVGDCSGGEAPSASALPKPKLHVLLITSDTPDLVRRHVASRFQEVMGKADVAIFSPALSAGSSCSLVGHFTASVCIAENVPAGAGPAVDSALQQWARVRCIGAAGGVGGVQDIFIYDPPSVRGAAGPTDMAGIERFLKETANRKVPYLQPSVCSAAQADDLEYDRSSLAYTCLVGHIYHAHYSMTHYSDIVRRVLDEDYALGPNMTVSTFSGECLQHVKKSAEEQKLMQEQRAAAVRYPAVMQIVSDEEDAKLRAAPAPTDQERQLIHIHLMVSKVLSVPPGLCDANFFERYVGTCFNKEQEVMLRQCRALFRYHYAQQLSVDQMRTAYDQKFKRLAGLPESAIAAAYFKPDTFWQPAIQVAALLDALAPGWRDKRKDSEVVYVEAATLNAALATWAEGRSDKEYEDLLEQLEDVCPRANQPGASRSGLMQLAGKENVKSAAEWVKKLLTAAFGCTLGKVKRSSKRGNKYPLDVTRYTDLAGRYQSGRLYRLCQMLSQGVEEYFKKCSRFVEDLDAVV